MKIGTFIKIISDEFLSQILPDENTGRHSNQLRYESVLSWFITFGAEENDLINSVMMKGKKDYCNKIMNPLSNVDMPIKDATYIKGRISQGGFKKVYTEAHLDSLAIQSLIEKFADNGYTINKSSIPKDITKVFHTLLDNRSKVNRNFSIRKAEFVNDHQIKVGGTIINLPDPLSVPNLPLARENNYVNALLCVYAQKEKTGAISITDLETMPVVYMKHMQLCREDFYSAESVLHKVRDIFSDAESEFIKMKDEVYSGILYHLNIPQKNGMARVDSTMNYLLTISFSKSYLSSAGNVLVGPEEKRGMVHMLVNEDKIEWIREDIDDESV